MAAGDIIFEDGTIVSQADLDKLLPLILEKLNSTAKDPGQYPVLDRLEGVTSIPCFNASYDLVRVLVSQLKGNTGSTPEITFNVTSLPYGSTPTVDKTGTAENPTISIGLPKGKDGEKIVWRKTATGIEIKYEEEPDSSYKTLFTFLEVMPDVSDFSEEGIALLQRPATEAATEARNTMTTIQSEADTAIQSANDAAEAAQTAAENVQDGKTPVIEIGTVENGSTAAATLTPAGTDESGNPKSALNLVLPKGKDGEPPVVNYSVLTGQPGTEVQVSQEEAGFTPEGNPIYNVTLTIPRGERGLPGLGSGNVYVDGTGLLAGEKYLFVPSATDSTEGTFVKYEDAPADGKTYGRKDGKWQEVSVGNALDVSFLITAFNNDERTITKAQLNAIIQAYDKNIGVAYSSDTETRIIMPMYLVKESDILYHISLQLNAASQHGVLLSNIAFNINADTLTFEAFLQNIGLDNTGTGNKFLSDNGRYETISASVQEAPKDGKQYARKDGAWSDVSAVAILEATGDGSRFLSNDGSYKSTPKGAYLIDVDITETIQLLTVEQQLAFYGKTYTKPTNDNIVELLGGADGIREMCEKLNQKNGVVGIIPTQVLAYYPSYCVLDYLTMCSIPSAALTETGMYPTSPGDGDAFGMLGGYWFHNGKQPFYGTFEITIENFNTAGQTATYQHGLKNLKDTIGLASNEDGLMSIADKTKLNRLRSYVNSSGLSRLGYDWENIYVNLSANDSLSLVDSAFNTSNNGRSITIYVYCSASCTITIPTTGNYVSMCGSSYTCPAGKWVEFSLTCIEGKWHIALLEQE